MVSLVTEYCEPCFYRKSFAGSGNYCDYICMVGKPRPCPAGDGCTVRILTKRSKPEPITISSKRGRPKVERTEEEIAALEYERRLKRREYDRMKYHKNKEKNRIRSQLYYANNKEKIAARHKAWNEKNRERANQYAREFRRRQKEAKKNGITT